MRGNGARNHEFRLWLAMAAAALSGLGGCASSEAPEADDAQGVSLMWRSQEAQAKKPYKIKKGDFLWRMPIQMRPKGPQADKGSFEVYQFDPVVPCGWMFSDRDPAATTWHELWIFRSSYIFPGEGWPEGFISLAWLDVHDANNPLANVQVDFANKNAGPVLSILHNEGAGGVPGVLGANEPVTIFWHTITR